MVKHTFTVDEAHTMDKGEWTKAWLGENGAQRDELSVEMLLGHPGMAMKNHPMMVKHGETTSKRW